MCKPYIHLLAILLISGSFANCALALDASNTIQGTSCPSVKINCYKSQTGPCLAALGPFEEYWSKKDHKCLFVHEAYNTLLNACTLWGYPKATYAAVGEDPNCPSNGNQ